MPRVRTLFSRRTFVVGVLALLVVYAACYWLTESQWFKAVGYADVWHVRWVAQLQVGLLALLLFGSFMLGSVWLAVRPSLETVALPQAYRVFEQRLNRARRLILRSACIIAVALPLLLAKSLSTHWQEWLLLRYGWSTPVPQPWAQYANTFSLYLSPFLQPLIWACWVAVLATLILVTILGAPQAFYQLLARGKALDTRLYRQGSLVLAVLFVVRAAGYLLLRVETGLPAAGGLSLQQALLLSGQVICAFIAAGLLILCWLIRFRPRLVPTLRWPFRRILLVIGLGLAALFLPSLLAESVSPVNRFLSVQESWKAGVEQQGAARMAWGLNALEVPGVAPIKSLLPEKTPPTVPLWSESELLQARYGRSWPTQKMSSPQRGFFEIAGRRVLLETAALQADNEDHSLPWANRHLADVAEPSKGLVAFDPSLAVDGRPLQRKPDAVVAVKPMLYGPMPQPWLLTDKRETGAVDLANPWLRAAWAVRLRDVNLFLAEPRYRYLLWRRSAPERLAALAPFLAAGGEAQAATAATMLIWVTDGLTVSRTFPGGPAADSGALQGYNAAFDSVKMLMDARTGEVVFYAARPDAHCGPLLPVWQKVFPGLIWPSDGSPEELRRQYRYPQALFEMQASLLAGQQNGQRAGQQESFASADTASRTLNSSYTLMTKNGGANLVLQAPLVSRDGNEIEAQLVADCSQNYGRLRLLSDAKGAASPLAFTKGLDESMLERNRAGGAAFLKLAPDERWVFGDVVLAPGRGGESWVPVFRTSENEMRLAAVIVGRGAKKGVGASVEEAYFDLLQHYEVPAASGDLSVQDLVARAARLQSQAENAVRRGAMTEWSRVMAQQRATLSLLQGKLHTSKND